MWFCEKFREINWFTKFLYLDDFTKQCVAKISWKYFSKIDCLPTADWWPYLWVWKWSYTLFKLHFPSIETCCWTSMASISLSHWGFLGVKMLEFLRPSLELQSCLVDESCSKQFYVAKLTNFPCFRIFCCLTEKHLLWQRNCHFALVKDDSCHSLFKA